MQNSHLLIQLIHNGRAVWQVFEALDPKLCRRMTDFELESLGRESIRALGEIMREEHKPKKVVNAAEKQNRKGETQ